MGNHPAATHPAHRPLQSLGLRLVDSLAIQPIGVALVGPIATAIGITTTLYLAAGLEVLAMTALVLMHDICTIGPPGPV